MMKTKKNKRKPIDITLTEFQSDKKSLYKVTRNLSGTSISETKIFRTKKRAEQQFEEWLN